MTLILFDIDGTLTATSEADNGCFERAFERVFGFPLPTTDWSHYEHATDVAIIQEAVLKRFGQRLLSTDVQRFEDAYLAELEAAFARNPSGFAEVPGALAMLRTIAASDEFRAALATGGMRRTATFKLSTIGVDADSLPGAFANDALSRADIARYAVARANVVHARIICVGDGVWDVRTAAELAAPFVGVHCESDRAQLAAAGATTLLEDYADLGAFFDAVRTAKVPGPCCR
jgi:phosphoglycolate phosphatase-like HAD superfamily hydrolase